MRTAQAAVLEAFNAPLRLHTYAVPSPVEPGAVLVRTEMAGICGTDVHLWQGQLPIKLPVILGHETVGRIAELGEGVEKDWSGQPLKVGDRVTWNSAVSCGQCYYCAVKKQPTRCAQRRAYGIGYPCDCAPHFLGGYAEFHYLRPRTTIFKLPDDLPTESVIGAGCALITAIHGVERTGIAWQDNVVVQGAGPVGIAALAVTGEYLSVPASVGFIALLGIAVLNGVVMVSYFNQLIEAGSTPREAVWEGAQRRLRPVLMTAAITAGGLIPLLFATGPGSEIQKPLAIVVTGGLLTSTALTLLLLPMAYERFGVRKEATA